MAQNQTDIATQRKQAVDDLVKRTSNPLQPDFPPGWSVTSTQSGRVSRLTYEPKTPIEFREAQGMAEAATHSLMNESSG